MKVYKATFSAVEASATLVGQGFQNTSQLACRFGDGTIVSATYASSTEIDCPDPEPFTDKTSVVVEATVNGADFSIDGVVLTRYRKPYILSFHPASGPYGGGTSVFVSGEHFSNSGALACSFDGFVVPARLLSVTVLQCESPPRHENDDVVVEVATNGRDFTSDGQIFSFYRTKILAVIPSAGPVDGGTLVSIAGEGFSVSGDFVVRFGLVEVQATLTSSAWLQCVTPGQVEAGEVSISVATNGVDFDGDSKTVFRYTSPVSLSFVEPSWGLKGDEITIVLRGNGFINTTELTCSFGANWLHSSATFISASSVSCAVPLGVDAGEYIVSLTTNGIDFTENDVTFAILEEPRILSVSPVRGPHWGETSVHVKGVHIQRAPGLGCVFGLTTVDARWESSTSLWCTAPAGNAGDSVSFTITLDGRLYSSAALTFSFWDLSLTQCLSSVSSDGYDANTLPIANDPRHTNNSKMLYPILGFHSNLSSDAVYEQAVPYSSDDVAFSTPSLLCGSFALKLSWEQAIECKARPTRAAPSTSVGNASQLAYGHSSTIDAIATSILSIIPNRGPYGGGTTVVVVGTNFVDTEDLQCVFGALSVAARWVSPAMAVCASAPGEDIATVPFELTTNGVASMSAPVFFSYQEYPTVSTLVPSFGSIQGGTLISLRGKGFVFSSEIRARFGNTSVSVAFVSAQELRCIAPSSFKGEVKVSIGDHSKTFKSDGELFFVHAEAPIVDSLYPSRGSVTGGLKVRVQGHGFANSSYLACMFGNSGVVTATFVSSNEVECESPVVTESTSKEVEVTVNGIDFTSNGNLFTYTEAPFVLSATPDSGSASGGSVVLVEGMNFVDSDELVCQFGHVSVSGQWISSTLVQCVSPAGVANTTVSLTIPVGWNQRALGDIEFYFFTQPTVERISSSRGDMLGGITVSVFGTGFWFSGDIRVRFGRTDVPATFVGASELRCVVPASSPGLSTVLVSFNGVDFLGQDGVGYYYVVPTKVTALSPANGLQFGGTTITVDGSGFIHDSGLRCMFGGADVAAKYQSERQVTCVTPVAKENRAVTVTVTGDGNGSVAESKNFVYAENAHVSSVHPSRGPVSGGTSIRVDGYNFVDVQELRCMFGSQTVPARWVSPTKLRCVTPEASKAELVTFTISVQGVEGVSGAITFLYHTQPKLLSITPDVGSTDGGTPVSLIGDDFVFVIGLHARFGSTDVPIVFVNSTLLRCITAASSAQRVDVGLAINGISIADQRSIPYTFGSNPHVTSIEPSRGSIAGGTTIYIIGYGFDHTKSLACKFGWGDAKVIPASFVSTEELMCVAPVAVEGGSCAVEVTVNGVDFSGSGRRFIYHGSPFITSVNPTYGNTMGAALVLVQGGYFIDSEKLICHFGSSIETFGRWVSTTLVECVSPAADIIDVQQEAVVLLTISFNDHDQTAGVYFHLEQPAGIASIFPSTGSTVGGTNVILGGRGFIFAADLRARFDGVEVPVTFLSERSLGCISPAGDAGSVEVSQVVEQHAFSNVSVSFDYLHEVKVTKVVTKYVALTDTKTIVVINGSGFANMTSLACRFGASIVVPAFFASTSEMWCDVSAMPGFGVTYLDITVDGTTFVPAEIDFEIAVDGPPLVVRPSNGPMAGGILVEVSGRDFPRIDGVECVFGGRAVPAIWLSQQAIQCETPVWEEEASEVDVVIAVEGYHTGGVGSFHYTRASVVSIFPDEGEDTGGTLVSVFGSGFDGEKHWFCWFGLEKTPALVADDQGTKLHCMSPPKTGWDYSVHLGVAGGSGLPVFQPGVEFKYITSLETVSLDPASGSVLGGSSIVAIIRHGFGSYRPPLHCDFGEAGTSPSNWLNETAVRCLAPPSPYLGKVLVSVYSSSATNKQMENVSPFWYFRPPTVSFVYPLEIEANNDTRTSSAVTVTGSNFVGAGPLSCRIGDILVRALWLSASVMQCPVSTIRAGEHDIAVSNNMVDFVPAGARLFIAPRAPLAVSTGRVTPSRGSVEGGTLIEVFGPDVGLLNAVRHCVIGDSVVNASISGEDTIVCVTTPHEEGTMPVKVCDSDNGCSQVQGGFAYVVVPVLTSLSPDMGSMHGGTAVTLETSSGCGDVLGDVWCRLGENVQLAFSVGEDSVTCIMPPEKEGIIKVSISCNGLDFSTPLPFRYYYHEMMVYDVFPLSVSSDGGSVVHINGRGFHNFAGDVGAGLLCFFDHKPIVALWVSEVLALCRSPARGPGVGTFRVASSFRQELSMAINMTYVVTGHRENNYMLNPTAGTTNGGTVVSIVGEHGFAGPALCLFGEQTTHAMHVSSSEVACSAPAATVPGRVKVMLISSEYEKTVGEFEYQTYLQLIRVRPVVVDIDGGTTISVFWDETSGLIPNAVNISCKIGDMTVPALVHQYEARAECVAPTQQSGSVEVALWDGHHQLSRGNFTLSYSSLPVVTKISPFVGFSRGAGVVNVYGHNFAHSPDLVCSFDNSKAKQVEWLSSTHVQCVSPELRPGVSQVTVSFDGQRFSAPSNTSTFDVQQGLDITALDPSIGSVQGGTVVTVNGANFPLSGGLECLFGTTAASATVLSPSSLECISPRVGLGMMDVGLQVAGGTEPVKSSGKRGTFLAISREPAVHFVSPKSGPVAGGTRILIAGDNFPNGTKIVCRFQGTSTAAEITAQWLSFTTVTCTSPPWRRPERSVAVRIVVGGKAAGATLNSSTIFDFDMFPVVEAIHPVAGPESGGTEVRIHGANFRGSSMLACLICSTNANSCKTVPGAWVSPFELTCITPMHQPGLTMVTVIENGEDGTNGLEFVFVPTLQITGLFPRQGFVEGGTNVLVHVTNLAFTGSMACRFGELSTKAAFHGSGVVCASPQVLSAQTVPVEFSVNGVDFTSDGNTFEYLESSVDTWSVAVQPSYGDKRGATRIMFHALGDFNFDTPLLGGCECVFNDEATPALVISPSSATCHSPAFLEESVKNLSLRSTNGSTETAAMPFEVMPSIVLLSLEPSSGSASGGDSVIIRGSGFADTSLMCCRFGDETSSAELLSTTTLKCVSPPWSGKSSTSVLVEVSHNCGDFYGVGIDFQYEIGFVNSLGDIVHDTATDGQDQSIRCSAENGEFSPAGRSGYSFVVCASLADPLPLRQTHQRYGFANVTVTEDRGPVQLSLVAGPLEGGSTVVISGLDTSVDGSLCRFTDGVKVALATASPLPQAGAVRCSTPSWPVPGSVLVQVATDGMDLLTTGVPFVYYPQPVLHSVEPSWEYDAGRRMLHIAASRVAIATNPTCGFFDVANVLRAVVPAAWTTHEELWCFSPVLAPGIFHVEVSANGVDYTQESGLIWVVVDGPIIFDVSPVVGTSAGGTEITVHGKAFRFTSDAVCRFDETLVPATMVDEHHVVCTTPPSSRVLHRTSDVVDFALALNGEDARFSSINLPRFAYFADPVVRAISPQAGPIAGGTPVFVTGHNFVDAGSGIECRFGDGIVLATVLAVGRLVCTSPPHTEGAVTVDVKADASRIDMSKSGPRFVYSSSLGVSLSTAAVSSLNGIFLETELDGKPAGHVSTANSNSSGPVVDAVLAGQRVCTTSSKISSFSSDGSDCLSTSRAGAGKQSSFDKARVRSISPDNGPRVGGTPVVVTGLQFEFNRDFMCHFGPRRTLGHVVDPSHLVCPSPPTHTESKVDFAVTSAGQLLLSDNPTYYYADAPVVKDARPQVICEDSSTYIVLEGVGFRNSSSLTCLLNGDHAVTGTYLSGTSIACTVAQNSSGHIWLQVTNNGVEFSSSGHRVLVAPQPVVTGINRLAATSVGDAEVIVHGFYFMDVPELACVFEEQPVPATWISTEEIRCSLPALRMPGVVGVAVSLNRQQLVSTWFNFSYVPVPDTVVEAAQPVIGAPDDTARGGSLRSNGDNVCRLSNAGDAVAQVLDNSTVRCGAPPGPVRQMHMRDTTNINHLSAELVAFSHLARPTVNSLHPASGAVDGGTHVGVRGSGFVNATELECHFGMLRALSVVFVSTGEIICDTPPGVIPSLVPVTASFNGVSSTSSVNYRYVLNAIVLDVSPSEIFPNEPRQLTVTGVNFAHGPALMCFFNGAVTVKARWLSPSLLRCTVPSKLTPDDSPVAVSVSNNGQDVSTSAATIELRLLWTIYSISPDAGAVGQGTPVKVVLRNSQQLQNAVASGQVRCLFDMDPARAILALNPIERCSGQADQEPMMCIAVECTAPAQQTERDASLCIVGGGGAVLSNSVAFAYRASPMVSLIIPRSGPYAGGTAVSVHLRPNDFFGLPPATWCRFSDAYDDVYVKGEATVRGSGLMSVVCLSPPWRSYSGHQSLVNVELVIDGLKRVGDISSFTYSTQAGIFALAPEWGTSKGGTQVRIRGIGFGPHANWSCIFAGEPLSAVTAAVDTSLPTPGLWLSDEEVLCESPARPPGAAYVTLVADGEPTDGVLEFVVRSSSQMFSLVPFQGPASGGAVVNVTGDNFFFTGKASCRFGSRKVRATYMSSHSLLCVSPRAPPGVYPVSIALDGEHFEESTLSFQYLEDMRILSLTPTHGWSIGGTHTTLHVAGMHRYESNASFWCLFEDNREAAIGVDVKAGTVMCSSPKPENTPHGSATHDVAIATVSVVAGAGKLAAISTQVFHYVVPFTVTAVVPDRGLNGQRVLVFGENFDGRFGLACRFGAHTTPVTFVSSQIVACDAPAKGIGQVSVNVMSGGELPAWHTGAEFTFEQRIVLTSINPQSGSHGVVTLVTVVGSGFHPSADLTCRFGDLEASGMFVNSTQVRCLAPAQGRGDVHVSVHDKGTALSSNFLYFSYETELFMAQVVPLEGTLYGGTMLIITSNFNQTARDLRCTFTSQEGVSTSSQVEIHGASRQCKTPPSPGLAVETVEVCLTQGGETVARGASFRYSTPPVAHSIHPQMGCQRGGERVVVFGENFVPSNKLACKFSNTFTRTFALATAQFSSRTRITCITPEWHTATDMGMHATVDVTTNGVDFTSGGPGFVFKPFPTIFEVSPTAGPVKGGTVLTISGRSFPRERIFCRFGTIFVPAWVVSDAQVVCISPKTTDGLEGRVQLDLTVDGQEATARGVSFTYTSVVSQMGAVLGTKEFEGASYMLVDHESDEHDVYAGALSLPAINRLEPSSSSSSGSLKVLVHGSNFVSSTALTCSFGGVHLKAMFLSTRVVQCVAPRHMPADVFLEISNDGTAFSASRLTFSFYPDPCILSINPIHGTAEGSTLVTITGNHFRNSSYIACRFGDTTVPGLYLSSNQIICWSPPIERIGSAVQVKVRALNSYFVGNISRSCIVYCVCFVCRMKCISSLLFSAQPKTTVRV